MTRTSAWSLGLCAATIIALGAASAAANEFRQQKTRGWTGLVPTAWKLTLSRKYGTDPRHGVWVFKSSTGSGVLRINIAKDEGAAFKKLADANFERLAKRLSEMKTHESTITKDGDKDVSMRVVSGQMVRNDFMRPYTFARVMVREPARKALVTITLGLSDDKMDHERFSKILESIMDGLQLAGPAAGAVKKAKVTP